MNNRNMIFALTILFFIYLTAISSASCKLYYCNNAPTIISASKNAILGDTIVVEKVCRIDLTGYVINLSKGVTIKGNSIEDNRPVLYKTKADGLPIIDCIGGDVAISNIVFSGPDSNFKAQFYDSLSKLDKKEFYKYKPSKGINSNFDNIKISNCELKYFSHAGIAFYNPTNSITKSNSVSNCYIHDNYRPGLGYGIANDNTKCIIYNNYFNANRHAVQGTGRPLTSYIVINNIIGSKSFGHIFDMHGGFDRKDKTNIAGGTIVVFGNLNLCANQPFVKLRGIPQQCAIVFNNITFTENSKWVIMQLHEKGRLICFANSIFHGAKSISNEK